MLVERKGYQYREEEVRYSRRVGMAEIEKNEFNLNISRYSSTAVGEVEISLDAAHGELVKIEKTIATAKLKHNEFLKELGLRPLHKANRCVRMASPCWRTRRMWQPRYGKTSELPLNR